MACSTVQKGERIRWSDAISLVRSPWTVLQTRADFPASARISCVDFPAWIRSSGQTALSHQGDRVVEVITAGPRGGGSED